MTGAGAPAPGLAGHAFLRGMPSGDVALLAGAATGISVPAGHRFFDEGSEAEKFWLITRGHVALDLQLPGRPKLIVETLGGGDVIGLSWMSPASAWHFGAEAVLPTDAFELDREAVLALCDSNPGLGYRLTLRMTAVASRRLHATRIRLLDLYAVPGQ